MTVTKKTDDRYRFYVERRGSVYYVTVTDVQTGETVKGGGRSLRLLKSQLVEILEEEQDNKGKLFHVESRQI